MVQRSPFLTQSVAVSRSRRSLVRVMIDIADDWPGSRRPAALRVGSDVPRDAVARARRLSSATSSRVGASMIASSPAASVRNPRSEGVLGGVGEVADVDPAVVEVEAERRRVAVSEGE